MPWQAPAHKPMGWRPYEKRRVRTDEVDRSYGTRAWRELAKAVIRRDGGICSFCGKEGATLAHHVIEKRHGGTDHPDNIRAAHVACHNRHHHGKHS